MRLARRARCAAERNDVYRRRNVIYRRAVVYRLVALPGVNKL